MDPTNIQFMVFLAVLEAFLKLNSREEGNKLWGKANILFLSFLPSLIVLFGYVQFLKAVVLMLMEQQ